MAPIDASPRVFVVDASPRVFVVDATDHGQIGEPGAAYGEMQYGEAQYGEGA